jgi:hypothetical protein
VSSINDVLSNDFKIPSSAISTSSSTNLGFNYWVVPLTDAQASTLKGNTNVSAPAEF